MRSATARTGCMDSRRSKPEQLFPVLALLAAIGVGGAAAVRASTFEEALDLHLGGRLDEALEAYLGVAAATEASDPGIAAAAYTNACLIRMNRSEYEPALEACEAALKLRRVSGDQPRTARTLNNLGLTLQNLGRYREARERYLEALEINRESGDLPSAAQNLANLAGADILAGDYGAAFERVAEVLELADANPGADWRGPQRRVAFINEGVTLEKLGAYRAALESYRKALAEEGPIERDLQALLKVNLGVVYRNLGDPVRAVALFEEAAAAYRELDHASGLSNALLNTALARHLNLEQPAEAERLYREALALAAAVGDRPEEIQDLFYLATLLLEQERLDEADELFGRALAISEASGSAEGRWSSLAGRGRIAAARGELIDARSLFARALEAIEQVRSELRPETHRADFFGDKLSVFRAAVQTAADLDRRQPEAGHDADAFALAQRAKARELLDALGDERAGRPLGWQEIAGALGDDTLVEYFVAERDLIRWTVDRRGLEMRALGPAEPILSVVLRVHRALAAGREPAPAALGALAGQLLTAIDLAAGSRLHVAADGALRYLPFELLPDGSGGAPPLLDRAVVDYLPSGSALPFLAAAAHRRTLQTIALANPKLETGAPAARPAALIAARFGLGDLPAAEGELASLERWLGGPARLLTGAAATESAFRDAAREGARVIHLATHAVIDERPGRGAAVLLAAAGADDGLLYPREIAALDLSADLAVLAACRTALVSAEGGGSLASLTGAFLAAGARGVVATLWDVDDRVTAAFMDQFYWQLGRGVTPAEALRRAKQTFREQPEWRAPHLWAGYVLIGRAAPVVERAPLGWWLAGGLAVLVLVLALPAIWRWPGGGRAG